MFIANARDTIRRLRNHPSLLLWCGGNEIAPVFSSPAPELEACPLRRLLHAPPAVNAPPAWTLIRSLARLGGAGDGAALPMAHAKRQRLASGRLAAICAGMARAGQ